MVRIPLSQLLAYVSKFPMFLQYKMMVITPLISSKCLCQSLDLRWKNTIFFETYKIKIVAVTGT